LKNANEKRWHKSTLFVWYNSYDGKNARKGGETNRRDIKVFAYAEAFLFGGLYARQVFAAVRRARVRRADCGAVLPEARGGASGAA